MSKPPFIPPRPYIDPPSQETIEHLKSMTKEDHKAFKKSDAYKKHVLPALKRHKQQKRRKCQEWWKNNWIAILGLIFAFIAAIPVMLQGIEAILGWLG